MEYARIPMGCCETITNGIKVLRRAVEWENDNEVKKGEEFIMSMVGSGYSYYGEIYHKSKNHLYIKVVK